MPVTTTSRMSVGSSTTDYTPWSSTVMLWFQRNRVGDFRVNIRRLAGGGYRITATEEYPSRHTNEMMLATYDDVCEYIDMLCRSTLMDRDPENPILHFQYSVPNFPDVVVPIAQLQNQAFYNTFCETLDYHLDRA